MELTTTLTYINGSYYVRVPSNMVTYFRLPEIKENGECKIKDLAENRAEITFKKW